MQFTNTMIKRPVFTTVINLLVLLVGIMAFERLSIREYPNIDEPIITVDAKYPGASAEIMESRVTQIIEDSVSGIEGIEVMSSISRSESSQITVRFRIDRDVDDAANDVRDRVSRVQGALPEEVKDISIAKVEADAQPILYLAFSSDQHSPLEVTDVADRYVKDKLQNLNGVSGVRIFGERRFAMRIWLDRLKLAAYNLTPQDVLQALRNQNVELPAGRIESIKREFTVQATTDLRTAEEFNNLIIKQGPNYLVRLRDIGSAQIDAQNTRVNARFNGKPAVAMGVIKQSTANPLQVSKEVKEAIPEIVKALPPGMNVQVAYDSSIFIDRSIREVFKTIFEAVALVALVIFFFLRSFRSSLIPLITIPVSMIGAMALMLALGFSINTLTLLAFVLAVGLVVDDAIVMLENIYRYIEEGMEPMAASLKGAKEIGFAVLAMTITLAAVYVPIGLMTGRTGRLFTEFAWTLAGAVIVSGFVALTLSPMMCARILKHETGEGVASRTISNFLNRLTSGYQNLLERVIGKRNLVIALVIAVLAAAGLLLKTIPSELAPIEDRGVVVGIGVAPEGSTIDYTDKYARALEAIYAGNTSIEKYFVIVGFPTVSNLISFIRLYDWDNRDIKSQQLAAQLMGPMFAVPGILAFPVTPPSLGASARSQPIEFVVQTTQGYDELQIIVNKLMDEARQNFPGLRNIDTDLKLNKPELKIEMNREKAALMGIAVEEIGRSLETMLGGSQVTRFKQNGKQYDVIVQVADADRRNPQDMDSIYMRAANGDMVPLSNLLNITESIAPKELNRFNKLRAAKITATLAPGTTMGQALTFLQDAARKTLPGTAQYDMDGQSREFKQSSSGLYMTFLLALIFIYLVLAAQFESFRDPLMIMLTVPLSVTGALFTLYLTGGTINVYSQIGLVTLIGLITKHGILIVEFANQKQVMGKSIRESIIESAVQRLRPILMTTGAMVLGAVPLALADGAGAESRASIGWVIVGGMVFGTFFTLFVVPAIYNAFAKQHVLADLADDNAKSHIL